MWAVLVDSEVLGSEQVVFHCEPFPSSLTGAELEINRLLGVVGRNVSKKKKNLQEVDREPDQVTP